MVTSGAIAAGLPVLGLHPRPTDPALLQAVSAVGQSRLMGHYDRSLEAVGLVGGQVLLAPLDFMHRAQYLHARETLRLLLDLGVVPVVNENDAVADDEIRFGDNDRLAALVANLLQADLLVLLTDAAGLFTADPRLDEQASLVEEVREVDQVLALAGGAGQRPGQRRYGLQAGGGEDRSLVGRPGRHRLGRAGRRAAGRRGGRARGRHRGQAPPRPPVRPQALDRLRAGPRGDRRRGRRCQESPHGQGRLAVAGRRTRGARRVQPGDAVEVTGPDGEVFAKGLVRHSAKALSEWAGRRTSELPPEVPKEVVHRDDLVILP